MRDNGGVDGFETRQRSRTHTYLDELVAGSDEITLVDVELRRLLSVCGDSVSCCESCGKNEKRVKNDHSSGTGFKEPLVNALHPAKRIGKRE